MQYNINRSTNTWMKNNNENIQNLAKIFLQSPKNIKIISSVKVPDDENDFFYQWFLNKRINHRVVKDEMLKMKSIV